MKLHLGCGHHMLAGYVNVDKCWPFEGAVPAGIPHNSSFLQRDLESFPWPWDDGAAEEVLLVHTLEHLGRTPDLFIGIMKELYRVCAPGALVKIVVPHPRHDHFLGDPTHVRVITPEVLSLFSKENCRRWKEAGASNTPLAVYHDVDFDLAEKSVVLDEPYRSQFREGRIDAVALDDALRHQNNVATEIRLTLRVMK